MSRIKDLFNAALDLEPEARAAFFDRECTSDPELRRRLDILLRAHDDPDSAVAGPLAGRTGTFAPDEPSTGTFGDPDSTSTHVPQPDAGTVIAGKYKLIELIGEGGMGSVWMAQQTEPIKRAVAVKLIRAGMDSKAVLARFDAERQALAVMDHPNIARVLDGGATADGRPFFVMELVKGVPITQFCDERKLTPKQRLELFVPVCHAIQHAHQKGVIHRDIKPNNVLVALYDDRPVPKVIDFGIAKATGTALTDHTLMTGFGAVVGTPEYMSPEQASLNNLDIDTRSDVYSLGVLLYELLTGTTPVDRKTIGKAMILEVLRIVREVEAPRPSAKLSSSGTLPSVAANRSTEPARLSWLLKRDLDWIVLKALEKDRGRRYESANGLAADIQRYLAGEAVQAHPPSTTYRLRKFARKNRVLLATVTAFAGLLIAAAVVSSWLAVKAKRAEEVAEQKRIEAEENAKTASVNAERAETNAKQSKFNADALGKVSEENLFGRVDTEIQRLSLLIDLNLVKLRSDPKLGILHLARPLPTTIGPIAMVTPDRPRKLETWLYMDNRPEYIALREFVTAAVLTSGQDYAPLLPPITHNGHAVDRVYINPDGKTALTVGKDRSGHLSNLRAGESIAVLWEGNEGVVICGFSPDGRTIFTDNASDTVKFWDAHSGKSPGRTEPRPYAIPKAFMTDRALSSTSVSNERLLKCIRLYDGILPPQDPRDAIPISIIVNGPIELWDVMTGRLKATLDCRGARDVRLTTCGKWVTAIDEGQSTALVFSADDGRLVSRLQHPNGADLRGVDASPSGKRIATIATDGERRTTIRVWDTDSWTSKPVAWQLKRDHYPRELQFWAEDTLRGNA